MFMPNWLRRLWYGRYHITLARQITGEETLQITFSENNAEDFKGRIGMVMETLRDHMIQHNEKVVLSYNAQITNLQKVIDNKNEELAELNMKYDKKHLKVHKGNSPAQV